MFFLPARRTVATLTLLMGVWLWSAAAGAQESFRFRTGVDLVNVTATVTDAGGRFVPGLTQGGLHRLRRRSADRHHAFQRRAGSGQPRHRPRHQRQHGRARNWRPRGSRSNAFSSTSWAPDDEVFLYRFDNAPHLVEGWTTDRQRIRDDLLAVRADGATALYDAIAQALPLLESGRHRKKALLVISDGNDTSSRIELAALKRLIRESEALVYAIGIDAQNTLSLGTGASRQQLTRFAQRRRAVSRGRSRSRGARRPAPQSADSRRAAGNDAGASAHADQQSPAHQCRPGRRAGELQRAARHHRRQRRPDRDHPRHGRPASRRPPESATS